MDQRTRRMYGAISSAAAKAATDLEMYCESCGKVLMLIPKGEIYFPITLDAENKEVCDCSWNCCSATEPNNPGYRGGNLHGAHRAYRKPSVSTG